MSEVKESEAQLFTWELKDAAWAEVSRPLLDQASRELDRLSYEAVRELGMEDQLKDPRVLAGMRSRE